MPSQKKHINKYNSLLAVAITLIIPTLCFSQTIIKGRVLYKGGKPSGASANVVIANSVSLETHTSENGSFSLVVPDPRSTDTVIISSVGYNSIRLPLKAAASKTEFVLIATVKSMEGVTVFSTQQTIGSTEEKVGYYRSWKHENRGGEIGRFFTVPYDKYKIDKIRFKAGNTCDTCLLMLHIREVENGLPGDDILVDSILVTVGNLSLDSKISEFDLTPFKNTFIEEEFFVSIEVLNCKNGIKGPCSFTFAGTEKGEYLYKSTADGKWFTVDDYKIYLKLFLRF